MTTSNKIKVPVYSGNFSNTTTTGAGAGARGLVSMAEQFAACGCSIVEMTGNTGAGRCLGIEAMSMGDALASRETAGDARCSAAFPSLLYQCQQQLDQRIVERSAYKLRARMQGDGRTVEQAAIDAAIQDALGAVAMWRAGVVITREDGADVATAAEDMEKHVARVAWRALVKSLSSDSVGSTIQIHGGAEDDWLWAAALPGESRDERAARLRIERRRPDMQRSLGVKLMQFEAGRGRRAAALAKVATALHAMLDGATLDEAAEFAGFKPYGRHPAGDNFLRAAKRIGILPDGFTVPRRGR